MANQAPPPISSPDAPPFTVLALTAPGVVPQSVRMGPVAWAGGLGVIAPWDQNGKYGQPVQTQFPTNIPGVQLRCGVEDMAKGWYFPSRSATPSWQQQQAPANVPGPQLLGRSFSGPLGGIQVASIGNQLANNAVINSSGGKLGVIAAEHLAQSGTS